MKEMRFGAADGEWRVAFAFHPTREVVLLVAGNKSGGSERRVNRALLRKADERFDPHFADLFAKALLQASAAAPAVPLNRLDDVPI